MIFLPCELWAVEIYVLFAVGAVHTFLSFEHLLCFTDKKEEINVLIYKEIQNGSGAKSYMRKGFLIYKKMRKYLTIYEEAVSHI